MIIYFSSCYNIQVRFYHGPTDVLLLHPLCFSCVDHQWIGHDRHKPQLISFGAVFPLRLITTRHMKRKYSRIQNAQQDRKINVEASENCIAKLWLPIPSLPIKTLALKRAYYCWLKQTYSVSFTGFRPVWFAWHQSWCVNSWADTAWQTGDPERPSRDRTQKYRT